MKKNCKKLLQTHPWQMSLNSYDLAYSMPGVIKDDAVDLRRLWLNALSALNQTFLQIHPHLTEEKNKGGRS